VPEYIVGVYSDPGHVLRILRVSDESPEVAFIAPAEARSAAAVD